MDVDDMGLPDDEFRKKLRKLVHEGFDFDDLLDAAEMRNRLMQEIGEAMRKHSRDPSMHTVLPPIQVRMEDLPEFFDGFINSKLGLSLSSLPSAIEFTNRICHSGSQAAKSKLKELLAGIVKGEDNDTTVALVVEFLKRELD
jgi:hypothetical protein